MKHMKIEPKSKLIKNKPALLALAAVVVLCTGVFLNTLAWLSDGEKKVKNTFDTAQVTCEISENFDGVEKKDIEVKNTSDIYAYMRVAVVCNYVNAKGEITGRADLPAGLTLGNNWIKGSDGYYYYTYPLVPNGYTAILFQEEINDGNGLQVTILAEAIQAEGNLSGKSPAELVWDSAVIGVNNDGTLIIN